tara:strand:- start:694 stop:876 length:183 start_codon:yes stop_codon:yes gene_type:complete
MKLPSKKRIVIEISLVIIWFALRFTLENHYDFNIPFYVSFIVIISILLFAQKILDIFNIK